MTFIRTLETVDWVLILLFSVFYLTYLIRITRIAGALRSPYSGVFYKLPLRILYFGLILFAFLGPTSGIGHKEEVKSIGKDIFVCIDLSLSMNANDIAPTRLEKVKYELKNMVKAFGSDRIGLIIFSSEAYSQSPLTFDQSILFNLIESMNTQLVPNAGTDFGPPLQMALKGLSDENIPTNQMKSKVVLLISDGEDFGENTDNAIEKIQKAGIKLFTLGVGTKRGSTIRDGRGIKRDRNGQEVITKLDARSLKDLAAKTRGKYFEISDKSNDMNRLINTIKGIKGELKDTRLLDTSSNRYFPVLMIALFLLCIDVATNVRTVKI